MGMSKVRSALLLLSEVPVVAQKAVLMFVTVSLGLGQWALALGFARRLKTNLNDGRLVSACAFCSSVLLFAVAALMARSGP